MSDTCYVVQPPLHFFGTKFGVARMQSASSAHPSARSTRGGAGKSDGRASGKLLAAPNGSLAWLLAHLHAWLGIVAGSASRLHASRGSELE